MVNVNIPVESEFWEGFTIVVTDLDKLSVWVWESILMTNLGCL